MRTTLPLAMALLATIVVLPACGGGSGGGGGGGGAPAIPGFVTVAEAEPNNTSGTANPLTLGEAGTGALVAAGEVDYWSFTVAAPGYVRIQIFALRLDQAAWNAVPNSAVLTVFAPDGVTKISEHDSNGDVLANSSVGGIADRDMDGVRLDAAGTYFIRVAQDAAASGGATYAVAVTSLSVPGIQAEVEAEGVAGVNDTTGTAQGIIVGTVEGSLFGAEADVYSFNVTQVPAIARFETWSWRNGRSGAAPTDISAPVVTIIDTDGTTALSTAIGGYDLDGIVSMALTAAGTYYVRLAPQLAATDGRYRMEYDLRAVGSITEAEGNNTALAANALQPGQFVSGTTGPGDPDFFSFVGTAGDMRAIRYWSGTNHATSPNPVTLTIRAPDGTTLLPSTVGGAGGRVTEHSFILQQTGTHFVRVTGALATDYILRNVLNKTAAVESEPNDLMGTADSLDANGNAAGVILVGADVDWYTFSAQAGELVTVRCFASRPITLADADRIGYGSALLPILTALDSGGATLATSVYTPSAGRFAQGRVGRVPTVEVSFVAPATDTYFVRVGDEGAVGGADRYYLIERR